MDTLVYKRSDFPVLNLDTDDMHVLGHKIKSCLKRYGFLVVKNTHIEEELIDSCYKLSENFFSLSSPIKNKYSARGDLNNDINDIGYHPFKSETAMIASKPDIKEFFHVGRELENNEEDIYYSRNNWPAELPDFKYAHTSLWESLSQLSIQLLNHLASCYDIDKSYMDSIMIRPSSILRSIYYPPVTHDESRDNYVRAAQHTGINLIGLQCLATASGLEFFTPSKEWVCLKQGDFDDCISVNMGEMINYLTNNEIQPTLHRVVNHQDVTSTLARQAIVFFTHPNLSSALIPRNPSSKEIYMKARQWVHERLSQIKTK